MATFQLRGHLACLILDQPETKNKFSIDLLQRLKMLLEEIRANPEVRAVALFSSSPKIFAAGADMNELLQLDPTSAEHYADLGLAVMGLLEQMKVPVTALVSGPCFGGAFDLVMACRHVWATPDAVFCHPGVKIGIMTGFGGTVRLPRRIAPSLAWNLLLTGRLFKAEEAYRTGFIERLFSTHKEMITAATVSLQAP